MKYLSFGLTGSEYVAGSFTSRRYKWLATCERLMDLSMIIANWNTRDLLGRTKRRFDFTQAFGVGAAAGLLGVIVATGLGDWLLPFVYTQTIAGFDYAVYSWILLGAMVSLHRLVATEATDKVGRSQPAHV